MSELYDKLAKLRDENRSFSKSKYIIKIENNVFRKLLDIAFCNEEEPDKLPKVFFVHDVNLYQADFEDLMKRIGLNVTVEETSHNYVRGNTFKVTQI